MGRHRQVDCEICHRLIRSDHVARHRRTHNTLRSVHGERVMKDETVQRALDTLKTLFEQHPSTIWADNQWKSIDTNVKVANFGDIQYIVGNLKHQNLLKAIKRNHYKFLTLDFIEQFDSIPTSDDGWQDYFIDNRNIFFEDDYWWHIITEDTTLYAKLVEQNNPWYRVFGGACRCICSEIGRQPLSEDAVKELILSDQVHMHFIVISKLRWAELGPHILKLTNGVVHVARNSLGCPSSLDKMRLLHYINRRESSIGLPCHYKFEQNDLYQQFRWTPRSDEWHKLTDKVGIQVLRETLGVCRNCAKKGSKCHAHNHCVKEGLLPRVCLWDGKSTTCKCKSPICKLLKHKNLKRLREAGIKV